jgi:hypothetical protein
MQWAGGRRLCPELVGAFAASRLLSAILYDSAPVDVPIAAGAAVLLIVAALIAAWWPVRCAARVP